MASGFVAGTATFLLVCFLARAKLRGFDSMRGGAYLRRALLALVFLLPVPVAGLPPLTVNLWLLAALVVGAVPLVAQWRVLRVRLSPVTQSLLPPYQRRDRIKQAISLAGAAIGQEYLYRFVLLMGLLPVLGWPAAMVVTAGAFVVEHVVSRYARQVHSRTAYLGQAYLGLATAGLTLISHSLLPAIVAHATYNLPMVWETIRRPGRRDPQARDPQGEVPGPSVPARTTEYRATSATGGSHGDNGRG